MKENHVRGGDDGIVCPNGQTFTVGLIDEMTECTRVRHDPLLVSDSHRATVMFSNKTEKGLVLIILLS